MESHSKLLLTSVFGPYAVDDAYGKKENLMELLHNQVTLTATELHYEGSIAVDTLLLNQADILPGEQVHVLNVNNGERIVTYAIEAPAGSGIISLRGAAARTGQVGDTLIIITYAAVAEAERSEFKSRTVYVNAKNQQLPRKD